MIYSRTPEEIAALETVAAAWVGTPFCANSSVIGAGVCCHLLVSEVLFAAGWLPRVQMPRGSPRHGAAGQRSLMEEWVDANPELFADVLPGADVELNPAAALAAARPGDVVCSRPARVPHHVSLVLSGGRFLQVQYGGSTQIASVLPSVWACRLARLWRPLK